MSEGEIEPCWRYLKVRFCADNELKWDIAPCLKKRPNSDMPYAELFVWKFHGTRSASCLFFASARLRGF